MFRALFFRSRTGSSAEPPSRSATGRVAKTQPPQAFGPRPWSSCLGDWLGASGWRVSGVELPSSFGHARLDAVAAARLEFADAVFDVRSAEAAIALDRIAVARSLHELWHLRGEVFGEVSRRHDQAEAERRLAAIDRHFAPRSVFARWREADGGAAERSAR